MIPLTGLYAIRALAVLGRESTKGFIAANQLARTVGAPPNYLGKLLQMMTRHRLVISQKGSTGGFRLARPAEQITLGEVVQCLQPTGRWQGCLLSGAICSEENPCAVHERWKRIRHEYQDLLSKTTVAQVDANHPAWVWGGDD